MVSLTGSLLIPKFFWSSSKSCVSSKASVLKGAQSCVSSKAAQNARVARGVRECVRPRLAGAEFTSLGFCPKPLAYWSHVWRQSRRPSVCAGVALAVRPVRPSAPNIRPVPKFLPKVPAQSSAPRFRVNIVRVPQLFRNCRNCPKLPALETRGRSAAEAVGRHDFWGDHRGDAVWQSSPTRVVCVLKSSPEITSCVS